MTTPTPKTTPIQKAATATAGAMPAGKVVVLVMAEQHTVIQAQPGQHYKLVRAAGGKAELVPSGLEVPADNAIAVRQGDDMLLRYENATSVTVQGFYAVAAEVSVGSVELLGEAGQSVVLSGEAASGSAFGKGGTLVYAHGSKDTLLAMAQSDSELTTVLSSLSGEVVSYLPAAASAGFVAAAPASGFGLSGVLGIVGGLVAAAGSSSGGGKAAAPDLVIPLTTINGNIVAGAVIVANGLTVTAYKADGTVLGSAKVSDTGGYSITYQSTYSGAVLLKVTDSGSGAYYLDEASAAGKHLTGSLYAMVSVVAGQTIANITPLTDMAAQKVGIVMGLNGVETITATAASVTQANQVVAKFFGLSSSQQITELQAAPVLDVSGAAQASNLYGKVMTSISGAELQTGASTEAVLATLLSDMVFSGATAGFTADTAGQAARILLLGGVSNTLQNGLLTVAEARLC